MCGVVFSYSVISIVVGFFNLSLCWYYMVHFTVRSIIFLFSSYWPGIEKVHVMLKD